MKTLLLIILFALFSTNIVAQTNTVIDTDRDGLIDINDLETLNAIRYQLDGTSYRTTTTETVMGITEGCPKNRCIGYELMRNLDFNDDESYSSTANRITWTTGAGWQPIGNSLSNAFSGKFEGNGFTIYNLKISRSGTSGIGLFGYTGSRAEITNVGSLNVNIIGNFDVGSLVGRNGGAITNSYATGSISGDRNVGSLVGYNFNGIITNSYATSSVSGSSDVGGLVGDNSRGSITNSYATGSVSGVDSNVGGLVGYNFSGTITNSYATGSVSGDSDVGGLAGDNFSGTITNSYATGFVSGVDRNIGGLVGRNAGSITNSYWDVNTSGIVGGTNGMGKTRGELIAGSAQDTDRNKPYYQWSTTNWYFGTSGQYPILKYTDNPRTVSSECREDDTTTDLPLCGSLLSSTLRYGLSELQLAEGDLSPDFDVVVPNYRGTAVNSISTIQFRPITVNPDAKVYVTANEERGTAIDSGGESGIISLNPDGITTTTIVVENRGETTQTVIYTLYLNYYEFNGDVDRDDDGWIEVDNLEELNAMRYQLDGTGYRKSETALKVSVGCPNNRCRGYELMRNLDFNDDESYSSPANRITWTTGAGWQPIGDSSNAFRSEFGGNGFTISNLTIDRSDTGEVGLFGYTSSGAQIANVVLLNVNIIGRSDVGGLVGRNDDGTITNSYAIGSVSGVLWVGGLVGRNAGSITNSYATSSVSGGNNDVGGLVGRNEGTITNSYATGFVSGVVRVGGLVGLNSGGSITNSYATASVSEGSDVGGLVGRNSRGIITNSYWDINTSGIAGGANGMGKTRGELIAGSAQDTDSNKPYYEWSTTNWYFGTGSQYPILKYTDNPNTDSSECRTTSTDDTITDPPVCGSLLSPVLRDGLKELQLVEGNLSPDFDVVVPSYRGTLVSSASTIQFRPITVNLDAKVYITANEETRTIDSGDESGMISLNTDGITTITIEVENGGAIMQTVIYTLYLNYYEFNGDVDRDDDGLIEVDNLEELNAIRYQLDGTGYRESETALEVSVGCPNNVCRGYELTRDLDFNDDESYSSTANRITWTTGAGWQPIGDSFSNAFRSEFEGKGFTISNLTIDRSGTRQIGLFGYTGSGAEITNVGLLSVNIIGNFEVGGLVGLNRDGTITYSYAMGSVSGDNDVGGLVGENYGVIANSYAMVSVSGNGSSLGGLVGWNRGGTITNSYAMVSVLGNGNAGGLVGTNILSIITNSYATSFVSGDYNVGGLVGINNGSITNSYWDINTSGIETSDDGEGITTMALQGPTMQTGIYRSWSNEAWDFGTTEQYPALKYSDGTVIPNQGRPPPSEEVPIKVPVEANTKPTIMITPPTVPTMQLNDMTDVVVSVADDNFDLGDSVTLEAMSSSRTIVSVTTSAETDDITTNTSITFTLTAEQSGEAVITFTATDSNESTNSKTVSVRVNTPPTITSFDNTVSVKEGREQTIAVSVSDADTDNSLTLSLTAMNENQDVVELVTTSVIVMTNGSVTRDAQTLKIKGLKAGVATLNITVSDEHTESVSASVSVTVERNTAPTIIGIPEQPIRLLEGTETTLNVTINDADDDDSLSVSINTGNSLITTATIIATDGATRTLEVSGVGAGSATIMVTVNDGRDIANSRISEEFEVRVEANTKPTIMITPPTVPTMQLNDMTDIIVSVADDNFDLDDSVTLEAMSSSRTIVSVTTSAETDDITTNTSITFTLTAEQSGEAMITFTATDSNESTNSKTVSVRVNASPTITSFDNTVSVKEGREQTIAVSVSDADTDDSLTLSLTAMNENQDVVELVTTSVIVMTNGSVTRDAQTLKIKGLKAGVATLNITVSDAHTESVSASVLVTVERNTAPTIMITPPTVPTMQLNDMTDIIVSVADDNFDLGDSVTLEAMSSSRTIVSVTTSAETDDITTNTSIIFTLTAEQSGEAVITFTATDSNESTNSKTVSVRVNASPTITSFDNTVSVKEGREQTIAVSVSDADTDDSLTLSLTAMNENQDVVELVTTSVIVMTNGSVTRDAQTLKIKGLKAGVATLNITVSDAHTESVAASVLVTVERNTAPTIIGIPEQPIRLLERTETTLNVTINDADDDDDSLSVSIDTGNSLIATATIIATDGATRTLEVSGVGAGSATIMVTVNDGRGLSNSRILEEFEVRVEANTKPTIMITPPTVPTMQLNDMTDVVVSVADDNFDLGDSVTLEAMSSSRTIVSVTTSAETDDITTNTSITFTLTAEQSGEAVITFTATDSNESTNSKTVSVRVNASPTITSFDNTVSVKEGREQTIAVSVSDADPDDSLTLSLTAMNENQDIVELVTTSVIVMTNGSVARDAQTLKIKGLKAGVATLNITVSDEHTESVSASVSVTVERNTAPTIIGIPEQPIRLLEGTETTLNVVINDADDDDSPSVSIDTGNSLIATATIIATDGATRTLEVSGVGAGSATIMVTVNDGRGLSNSRISEEFEVRVEANTKPTIMITPPTVPTMQLNDMTDIIVSVADDNFDLGDSVTLEAMSSSRTIVSVTTSAETDDITTNTSIIFTLTAEQSGEAVITFTATDSNESTNSKTVSVRVNASPTITSFDNTVSVKEGREQTIAVSVSDADTDDSLTLSLTAMNENQDVVELVTTSVIVMTNGSVARDAQTLKIKGLKAGVATLNITVSDEHTESVSASVSVTVERNTAPTIIGIPEQPIRLLEGTETTLNVVINDADDDDSPSVSIDTGNSLIATATIIATDGATRTLEVSGVGAGSATIMVTVNDGRGLSNSRISEEFEVRVEANTKPTIMITPPTVPTMQLNDMTDIIVSVADDNFDLGDSVTLEAMSSSRTIVSVTTSAETDDITTNTSITFTLTAEQSGEAVITFTATDSNESTNSKTVSVRVNTPPTITSFDNTVSVKEGREQAIAVSVSDADTDDSLTLSLTAMNENQDIVELVTTSVMVMTNGSVARDAQTLKIKGLKAGVATLNITVSDAHTESVSASVLVTVERNTAPTIIGIPEQPIRLLEGTETTLNVTINDADDDDSLSVSIDTGNSLIATATIIATDGATRTLEVSGVGAGSATIMVTVNDGRDLSSSRILEEFEVRVEANTKPTIMITPPTVPTMQLNDMTDVVVLVADDNFDLGDSVTLEAMSSSRTIVSVTTSAETDDITTNTSITFTLTAEQSGEAVITFTATDSNESTNSKTVSVRVNTPPTITSFDNTVSVKEGREQTIAVSVSDADTDDSLTLSLTAMNENQDIVELVTTSVTVMTNGSVTRDAQALKIKGLKAGVATLNITVSDEHTESAPVSVSVTVERNTAPTIIGIPEQPIRLLEGTETTLNVVINDADVDDSLSVSIDTGNSLIATATIIATDGATRTLEVSGVGAGSATIMVTVNDGRDLSSSRILEEFEVRVEANTKPTIMITPPTVPTMQLNDMTDVVVLVADDNFDLGDSVTLEAMSSSRTIVSVATSAETDDITTNTSITFTLTAEQSGEAVITFTATDSNESTNSKTVSVRVNTPPTITSFDNTVSVKEGREQTIAVSVSDADPDDSLTLSLTAMNENQDIVELVTTSVIVMTNGSVARDAQTLKIKGLKAGVATLNITVSDEHTESVSASVLVTVERNTAPTIIGIPEQPIRLLEGTETTLNVTINDADDDDDSLSVSIDTGNSLIATATIIATDGATRTLEVSGVGAGSATIMVTVNDGRDLSSSRILEEFEVRVEANTKPTIMITPPTVPTMQLNDMTDVVVSVADDNFDLDDSVTLEAMSSSRTIVSVTTSAETDDITTNTSITFTLTAEQSGEAVITFTATDSNESTNSKTVSVRVNTPPTITSFDNTVSVKEGREQTIAVSVSDADTDDSLTLSLTAMNENQDVVELVTTSVMVMTNGSVARDAQTLKIKGLKAGVATLNITVSDEHTESAPASVSVTVERNTAPTIIGIPEQPIRLLERTKTTLSVTINDADDDDSPSVSIDTGNSLIATATIIATDGATRTLEVSGVGAGSATIMVTVNDGRDLSSSRISEEFEVRVEANTKPTIMITPPTVPTMQLNDMTDIIVSVADDNFDLDDSVTLEAMSSSRTIVSVTTSAETDDITTNTSITFTLTAEQSGEAVITFTATDSNESTNSKTVSVRVNTPPTITSFDNTVSVKEGREQTIAVSVSDADTDDSLTLSLTAMDENQDVVELVTTSVMVMTNGSVTRDAQTLKIKGLKAGVATLNITVSDEHTESAPVSVSVMVERNTAPTIIGIPEQPIRLLEGTETTLNVVINDADVDDSLSVSIDTGNSLIATATIIATDGATRTLEVSGVGAGSATIMVTVNDGRGLSNSRISEEFEVRVEANTKPTIMITPPTVPTMQLNDMTDVVVSVADDNFDLGDSVTLEAMSSSRTIVSVATSAETDDITTNTSIIFTLTAEQSGEAVITFTATDSNESTNSKTVSVRVNTPPTITSFDNTVSVKEGREQAIAVSVSDADTDDSLTLSLTAMNENQDVVELVTTSVMVMTNGSVTRDAQTLKIKGLKAGVATLNITVSDEHTELVSASVLVTVERNMAPTIIGIPEQPIRLLEGTKTTLNVTINDADDDDSLSVSIDTGNSLIATATIIATDGATRTLEVSGVGAGSATIMVTVNDGRGLSNSRISEEFEVRVEANTKPTIMITPSLDQTLSLNSTAHIVVSVADDNFDVDDIVTLEAMSSSRTIVSVTTSAETDDITTNTSITFTLTAEQSGEAVITFTATDSGGLGGRGAVSVRVHIAIRIHVKVFLEGLLQ